MGDGGVGKTTLLQRFISGIFMTDTKMSIGVDFHIYKYRHGDQPIHFQIWDLGGQERFQRMNVFELYAHGSHAIILAFDLSQLDTFENLHNWLDLARTVESDPLIVLIGTKKDLPTDVPRDLIHHWIKENEIPYFAETSSLTGENLHTLFEYATMELVTRLGIPHRIDDLILQKAQYEKILHIKPSKKEHKVIVPQKPQNRKVLY
jgi:small GTP-binding protein